jgi:RNA polymerase sigma-70 factor, ECF subfamily
MNLSNEEWLRLWRATLASRLPEQEEFAAHVTARLINRYRINGCSDKELKDAVQNCLLHLFRQERRVLRRYDPDRADFIHYLDSVGINQLWSYFRRSAIRMKLSEIDIEVASGLASRDYADSELNVNELMRKIRLLEPPEDRVVMLLHVQGFKDREISEILGIPPGTVATRIRRGRNNLRDWDL